MKTKNCFMVPRHINLSGIWYLDCKRSGQRCIEGVAQGIESVNQIERDYSRQKKSGLKVVTTNRHSQPRLPGSVVGEASMPSVRLFSPQDYRGHCTPGNRSVALLYKSYFAATSECVITACTDSAILFCTPTLRINFATWAFTGAFFNSQLSTEFLYWIGLPPASPALLFSRSVKVTRPAGKIRQPEPTTRAQ